MLSRFAYVLLVWTFILIGIIGNTIFSTLLIINGWNYYYFAYSTFCCIMIGFGMGLSVAHNLIKL